MADINVQVIDADGLAPVHSAVAAGGDRLQVGGSLFAVFKNTSAAAITVTLETPGSVQGLAIADRAISVPATNGEIFVSLDPGQYQNPTSGRAHVTYSAAAGLTVAVLSRG